MVEMQKKLHKKRTQNMLQCITQQMIHNHTAVVLSKTTTGVHDQFNHTGSYRNLVHSILQCTCDTNPSHTRLLLSLSTALMDYNSDYSVLLNFYQSMPY